MATQPQDRKQSHKEPFAFKHGGKIFKIKSMARLKMGLLLDVQEMSEGDGMMVILKEVATPTVMEAIRDMEIDEFQEFVMAWRKHSGVSLGELPAS